MSPEHKSVQPFLNQTSPSIAYFTGEVIIAIFAVFGNILVILSFIRTKNLRHPRNCFVLSLASADLLVGIIGIPVCLAISIGYPIGSLYGCLTCLASLRFVHSASILSYLLLTLDRWWAIAYPYSYHRRMTTKFAFGACLICWCLATMLGSIQFIGLYNREGWEKSDHHCFFIPVVNYEYQLVSNVIIVSIVSISILWVYGYIFLAIRRQQRVLSKFRAQRNTGEEDDGRNAEAFMCTMFTAKFRRDASLAMRIGKIIILFLICQMPFVTVLTIWAFCSYEDCPMPTWLIVSGVIVFHASAAINPFLYAFHLVEFRMAMKDTLCLFRDKMSIMY